MFSNSLLACVAGCLGLSTVGSTRITDENGVFLPTFQYRQLPPGVAVPPGLDIKMDLRGGLNKARIPNPYRLQLWVDVVTNNGEHVESGPTISMDRVKQDGSAAAASAVVGKPKRGCDHGCFARLDVHQSDNAFRIKRNILLEVCEEAKQSASNGVEDVYVCQLVIQDKETGQDILASKTCSAQTIFHANSAKRLVAKIYLSRLHEHNRE